MLVAASVLATVSGHGMDSFLPIYCLGSTGAVSLHYLELNPFCLSPLTSEIFLNKITGRIFASKHARASRETMLRHNAIAAAS